eukprot:scaffold11036_cov120-Isochrysis_galbana.AAC.1
MLSRVLAPRCSQSSLYWLREGGSVQSARRERAHELGKRGPARGAIFGPLLPSEKGGEEIVRGVGVRALAEEVAQGGDELPPRADDVEPA